jgi:hypothetical protein
MVLHKLVVELHFVEVHLCVRACGVRASRCLRVRVNVYVRRHQAVICINVDTMLERT